MKKLYLKRVAVVIAQVIVAPLRKVVVAKKILRAIMVVKSAVQVVMPIAHHSKGLTTRLTLHRLQRSHRKRSLTKDRSLQLISYLLS